MENHSAVFDFGRPGKEWKNEPKCRETMRTGNHLKKVKQRTAFFEEKKNFRNVPVAQG